MRLFLLFKPQVMPICITTLFIISTVIAGCTQRTRPETTKEQSSRENTTTEPKIVKREPFKIIGALTRIDPQSDTIETYVAIWKRFESYHDRLQSDSIDQAYYGVSFNTDEKGVFDYLAGMAVSEEIAAAEGLAEREIPAAVYAVFECPAEKIAEVKKFIFQKWLPLSQYEINVMNPVFEQYPSAGETASPVIIYVPIKDKAI
jgi:predicted transcriptional regulator YdeE